MWDCCSVVGCSSQLAMMWVTVGATNDVRPAIIRALVYYYVSHRSGSTHEAHHDCTFSRFGIPFPHIA